MIDPDELEMPGWKTPAMGQIKPSKLIKISKNMDDLMEFLSPEDELLDAGCFKGHLYEALHHQRYTGIDLFYDNIKEARQNFPGVRFEQKDLFDLKGKWDVVFCCRVLMHIPRFRDAISILRRCARKKLIVVLPIGDDAMLLEDVEGGRVYFRTFSEGMIQDTGGTVRLRHPYSTAIYDPLLS